MKMANISLKYDDSSWIDRISRTLQFLSLCLTHEQWVNLEWENHQICQKTLEFFDLFCAIVADFLF